MPEVMNPFSRVIARPLRVQAKNHSKKQNRLQVGIYTDSVNFFFPQVPFLRRFRGIISNWYLQVAATDPLMAPSTGPHAKNHPHRTSEARHHHSLSTVDALTLHLRSDFLFFSTWDQNPSPWSSKYDPGLSSVSRYAGGLVTAPPSSFVLQKQLWLPSAATLKWSAAIFPPALPTNEGNARTIAVLALEPTWLAVWTPLKNISQFGWLSPVYGKIKNVPNHQPATARSLTWVENAMTRENMKRPTPSCCQKVGLKPIKHTDWTGTS